MTRAEILEGLHGKQVITIADLHRAGFFGDITAAAVYLRLNQLPVGERPIDHGGVKAGGATVWVSAEGAADFVERHLAYWAARIAK